jgi:secreted PhoX family phosphatase
MGTWTNCGSTVTPWLSGLTSEEYEPIAADFGNVAGMSAYLGKQANPYDYGYIVEMTPNDLGDRVVKHLAMGRKSNENSAVAPDGRTVYFGDDGTDTVLFRFIADEAGDLSAGTLYAARITQTGGTGPLDHVFSLEWIELGSSSNDEVLAAIRALDVE